MEYSQPPGDYTRTAQLLLLHRRAHACVDEGDLDGAVRAVEATLLAHSETAELATAARMSQGRSIANRGEVDNLARWINGFVPEN